mmetsp:Transcript_32419/g.65069  ORF Transcript_32419/g.65069 Transcript_32419/m.65069 type:complete len:186 (+) Transcript_32419:25-582(+)
MGKRNQFTSKHVRNVADHGWPEPEGEQFIVRLVKSRGGNTMECEKADTSTLLCFLPAKFSKVVWAQRGDFLIVEPSAEEGATGKVHHTIVHILFPEQVQHLRKLPCWPAGFGERTSRPEQAAASSERATDVACDESGQTNQAGEGQVAEDEQSGSDSESDLFVNNNRLHEDSYEESDPSEDDDAK